MPRPTPPQGRASSARSPSRAPPRPRPAPTSRGPPTAASSSGRPARRRWPTRTRCCRPTASSTARSPGCSSTSACSSSPRTTSVPLLERARFLAIFATQPRRVLHGPGGRPQAPHRHRHRRALGLRASSRARCSSRSRWSRHELHGDARRGLRHAGAPGAASRGHHDRALGRADRGRARAGCAMFADPALPGADPARRRPGAPVPLHLRALAQPRRRAASTRATGKEHFARVKVPPLLPRLLRVEPGRTSPRWPTCTTPGSCRSRTSSRRTSTSSSRGWRSCEHHTFRVTRNEDLEVEEDDAENLLTALEKELTRRRFGPPVRLEVEDDIDAHVLDLLVRELGVAGVGGLPPAGAARPARPQRDRRPRPFRPALRPVRGPHPPRPRADRERQGPRHLRRRSASRTSCCTTRTTRSRPPCRRSSSRPPPTRRCWPSSRRSTAPAVTPRSSTPSSTRPRPASRCSRSSRSRRASTSRTTSRGRASSSRPACTSSTASSG